MTTRVQEATYPANLPATQTWFSQGWGLFKAAPFTLFLFTILPMILAGLVQQLPAPYSIILSKYCAWVMASMLWPLLHHLYVHKKVSVKAIFKAPGWSKVPMMALCGLSVLAFEVLVAFLLMGQSGIELTLWGVLHNVAPWQLGVIFATSAPLAVVLSIATASVLLKSMPVHTAVKHAISQSFNNRSLIILIAINALALFIAPFTLALGSLVLAPWLTCVSYYAYRSMYVTNGMQE